MRLVGVCSLSMQLFATPLAGVAAGTSTIRLDTGNIVKTSAASINTPASPEQAKAHAQHYKKKDEKAEQDFYHC